MGDTGDALKGYTIIKEGEAEILMHSSNAVFFNKTQVNNRDMSIAILRAFVHKRKEEHAAFCSKKIKRGGQNAEETQASEVIEGNDMCQNTKSNGNGKMLLSDPDQPVDGPTVLDEPIKGQGKLKPLRVLEALAASGLRSLRYAREVDGIDQVVALDNNEASIEACKKNIKFNDVAASSKVEAYLTDARVYMLTHPKEFDVVDLDPYGSPSVFLDSAVQSVADGGVLMCTATDMAVLCGGNGEVCYAKYGSYPLKGKYCHEMALRILLASIEAHANRYKRYIVPILSVQMDFYIRVFVRIYTSPNALKNTPLKLSYVYQCVGCDSFHLQSLGKTVIKNKTIRHQPGYGPVVPKECSDCGKRFNMGGPIWSAPIHDQSWVDSILTSVRSMKNRYPAYEKISSVLTTVSEELPDVPLFVSLHSLCATLKCTSPSAVMFRSAVINAGYRISGSHVNPLGLKTDAPMEVIWDIMRCWISNHPVKAQDPDQSGSSILSKKPKVEANFARAIASMSKAQTKKIRRFLPNPESHWGPKVKAGRQITSKHVSLLGLEKTNDAINHQEEEHVAKRQKLDEDCNTVSEQ
ncbi:tRNA (guanine(26)-N(2))-dimethyltransferase [Zostera marina]|uniref:tRNA (guanine(26)-N(2))-dimethyltransferase n=1 Tax=Zostera marina TaxID=29655 RepID=A0A0K9NW36_ZOSMR|nr:tRNA (guanine(26)-N(2))-dimethyltransferase [Zostera marina]